MRTSPVLRYLTVAGVLFLAVVLSLIPSCRKRVPVFCVPCCGPSSEDPCVNPDGMCCYIRVDSASASELRDVFTSSSLSVMYGPADHPILDSGGSQLEIWYGSPAEGQFTSYTSFDAAASALLDTQYPANHHVVLRSTSAPAEWQAWLDSAPPGASFEGEVTVKFQVDTLVQGPYIFDPFTLIWEVQSTDPGERTYVGNSTTSLGRYYEGRIMNRLWVLPDVDFDGNPNSHRNQLEQSLDQITAKAETRDYQAGVTQIDADILRRMDGHYGGDPSDDWVVTLTGQEAIRPAVLDYRKHLNVVTIP